MQYLRFYVALDLRAIFELNYKLERDLDSNTVP